MKNFFLSCLLFCLFYSFSASAKINEIFDITQIPQQQSQKNGVNKQFDVPENIFSEFLKERLQNVVKQDPGQVKSNSVFVEPSEEARKNQQKESKGFFEKIYDNALQRALNSAPLSSTERRDINTHTINAENIRQQQNEWERQSPDFPSINVTMPDGSTALVPAQEHIPFFMSEIQILTNGMVKFDETIVVVANGEKLKNGLSKPLPQKIVDKNGKESKLDYSILSVSANDQILDYTIVEKNGLNMLVPKGEYVLQPGVYTYKLSYVVSGAVLDYQDFREFYWNITGNAWNLVIAKIAAKISFPAGFPPLRVNSYSGYANQLEINNVLPVNEGSDAFGLVLTRPLFVGEGFHVIVSLPEESIMPLGLVDRFFSFLTQHSDILFSLAAFIAILLSFIISWYYMKQNKDVSKLSLKKNGVMCRYLNLNRFDATSIGCFLLEMYKKNIIDIQKADETVLLIKKTDNLSALNRYEKKAINKLFEKGDAVLNACKQNWLKFKRAAFFIEKNLKTNLRTYLFKINFVYLLFSFGMLLFAEACIALEKPATFYTFLYMLLSNLIMILGVATFILTLRNLIAKIVIRFFGILFLGASVLMLCGLVHPSAAFIILLCIITINLYTNIYSQRNGLLRLQINDVKNIRLNLLQQKEHLLFGKGIINVQENILALDLVEEYSQAHVKNDYNKLDAMVTMLQNLKK